MMKSYPCCCVALLVAALCIVDIVKAGELEVEVTRTPEECNRKSQEGDSLTMHYTGKLTDGSVFDSSLPRGEPLTFTVGKEEVIEGWDKGLLNMCEGERRTLTIPPEMGYGDGGAPPKIPGGATLVFDVELMKINYKPELY